MKVEESKSKENEQDSEPPKTLQKDEQKNVASKDNSPLAYKSINFEAQQQHRTPLPAGSSKYFGPAKAATSQHSNEYEHKTYKSKKFLERDRDPQPLPSSAGKFFTKQLKRSSVEIAFDELLEGEDVDEILKMNDLSEFGEINEDDDQQLNLTVRELGLFEYIWNMAIAILRIFNILR